MTTLVTGGAGYIGSHMVLALLDAGERVIVVDDLSTGHKRAVARAAALTAADIADQAVGSSAGDPAELVADARQIRSRLGWQAKHDDIDGIVADALAWERRLVAGSSVIWLASRFRPIFGLVAEARAEGQA